MTDAGDVAVDRQDKLFIREDLTFTAPAFVVPNFLEPMHLEGFWRATEDELILTVEVVDGMNRAEWGTPRPTTRLLTRSVTRLFGGDGVAASCRISDSEKSCTFR